MGRIRTQVLRKLCGATFQKRQEVAGMDAPPQHRALGGEGGSVELEGPGPPGVAGTPLHRQECRVLGLPAPPTSPLPSRPGQHHELTQHFSNPTQDWHFVKCVEGLPWWPVETPSSQCRGPASSPGQGTRSHMPQLRPVTAK